MSCNSCSNITLPGVVGPAGAPGAPGTNGNGIVSVSFQSTTNPGGTPAVAGYTDTYRITYTDAPTFDYDIVNGTNGTFGVNGTTLLKSITTEQVVTASSYASGNVFSHTVPLNTLDANEDTLSFEGLVLNTKDDASLVGVNITFASTDLILAWVSGFPSYPNIEVLGEEAYKIKVDIVRVSNTTVKIEVELNMLAYVLGTYAESYLAYNSNTASNRYIKRMGQTITGLDLATTAYDFDVNLQTNSASRPTKLVQGKLILLNKG